MSVYAVPYIGNEFTYYQPDGEAIQVRLYGDEFYAVAETLDGHVIVQDPVTREFQYAELSADGSEFQPTGIRVGKSKQQGTKAKAEKDRIGKLSKKQRINRKAHKEKSDAMRKRLGFDKNGRLLADAVQSASGDTTATAESADVTPAGITGTRVTLVLLAKFPDRPGDVTLTQAQVNNAFNAVPHTEFGNATSVKGYFRIQSNNKLELSSVVTAYFTAAHPRDYYTDPAISYGSRAKELLIEGLEVLKSKNFNFAQLDGDGDGKVDAVSLLYAGPTVNDWAKGLWPHASGVVWAGFSAYGLSTGAPYQITNLGNTLAIGTICHELGHAVIKFPDLYSYDGNAANVGSFCLMSGGNWASGGRHPTSICGPLKYDAGWATVQNATASTSQTYTLQVDQNTVVRFANPANSGEYFMAEIRLRSGYEGPYGGDTASVCPSPGLVLFHYLATGSNPSSTIFTSDNPNCNYSKPYRHLLIERNPTTAYTPWYDDPTPDANDAFTTGDTVSSTTKPELKFWSASGRTVASGANINSISVSSSSLSFRIGTPVVNHAPVANAQSVTTTQNVAKAITLTGSDPDGDVLTYTIVTQPSHGTLSGSAANRTYTPAANYSGSDSFAFKVTDSKGASSANATVSITVTASSGGPAGYIWCASENGTCVFSNTVDVAYGANGSFNFKYGVTGSISFNNATFGDPAPGVVKAGYYRVVGTSQPGLLAEFFDYTTSLSVLPNLTGKTPNVTRTDAQINYASTTGLWSGLPSNMSDTFASRHTGRIKISTAGSYTFYLSSDDGSKMWLDGALIINNDGLHGMTELSSVKSLSAGFHDIRVEFFENTGGAGLVLSWAGPGIAKQVVPSSVLVPVEPGLWYGTVPGDINTTAANPKTKVTTSLSETEDAIAGNTTEIYTGQIFDADGHISFTEDIDDRTRLYIDGNLVISSDNWTDRVSTADLRLTPGWHDFELRISNGGGGSGPHTAPGFGYDPNGGTSWRHPSDPGDGSLFRAQQGSAPPVNTPPVANAQSVTTAEDTAKAITLIGSDADGDALTFAIVTSPAHGTLSGSGANRTYTPAANYNGSDSFVFRVNDGKANSANATVSISVTAVNDAPVANAQSVTTAEDTAKAITLTGSDADGDALTYTTVTAPSHGSLSGSGANRTYTPAANYYGSDSFTFRVNDGTVNSANATVSITITAVNDAPVANAQSVTAVQNTAKAITLTGSDPDGDSLTYTIMTSPAHGTLSGTGASKTYTPAANYSGSDAFTFKVTDSNGASSGSATVSITVTAVSGGPDGYTWCANEGGSYTFTNTVDVAYGANGKFNYKYGVSGSITFNNATFGDPAPGVVKAGYYRAVGTAQPGLLAEFFDFASPLSALPDMGSASPHVTRTDAQINYPSVATVWPGLPASMIDTFVSRHTGTIQIPTSGTYTFYLSSDDGSKMWLDDQLIINNDGLHGMTELSASRTLTAGAHDIRVEFFENNGNAGLILSWSGPGIAKQVVPANALSHSTSTGPVSPGFRVTEYYLTSGNFAGTTATVTLNQNLANDYFILVRGSRDGDGLSMPDNDYARVISVPGGKGELTASAAANQIVLKRAVADVNWEGVVTVVECTNPDSADGFRLIDIVETTMITASGTDTCAAWSDLNRVVLFGGYRGGGVELLGNPTVRSQGSSAYTRLYPSGSGTINWSRNTGGETLYSAIMTTFVVQWGDEWGVQRVNVAGSSGGDGANATGEYKTAAISPVSRNSTWVWGTGTRADAGIGDCAEACLVTLGNGVNQNATESTVAVGSEYTDAYDFDLYVMSHPSLKVDYRFKADGNSADTDTAVPVDTSTAGARFAWAYNGVNGTGDYFPRPRTWARYTANGTVTISRGFSGQDFPAWIQAVDLSGLNE